MAKRSPSPANPKKLLVKKPSSGKKAPKKSPTTRVSGNRSPSRNKPQDTAPSTARLPATTRSTSGRNISNNTSRDHLFRIFTIFSELQNGRRTKLSQLADFCGVVERTIQRDIDTMRTLLDIGITSKNIGRIVGDSLLKSGDKEYTLDPAQKHFPVVRVGENDLLTIHFLREVLEQYKNTSIGKSMLDSFKRSFGVLTGTTDWKRWSRVLHFRFEGRPEVAKEDVRYFEILHKAILENREVSFIYRSMSNTPSPGERVRTLHPNFIFMRNGSYYLHAFDPEEKKEKIFKFARIRSLKLRDEKFKPQLRYPDPADYFFYSFAVIPCSEPPKENVVLEFTGKSVRRVEETLWHPKQKLTKLSGDRVRLELPFPEATYLELKPWLLSWGVSVKVIGPKKLKEEFAADVRAMAATLA
jgi:predicted DNA-binding transcriptional regulator YafY